MTTWWTYLVRCGDDSLYCGVTTDIKRRVKEHNTSASRSSRYCRSRRPVKAVWQFELPSKSHALQLEARIKKLDRSAKEKLVESYLRKWYSDAIDAVWNRVFKGGS